MRAVLVICLVFPAGVLAGPLYAAKVWPSKVKRTEDRLEYVYDLSAVKAGAVSPDARAEVSPNELSAFLARLPKEARLSLTLEGAVVAMAAHGGLERAPLAPTFSKVPPSPVSGDSPRLLPSLDLVLWKVRQVEDGALAAIEIAAESGSLGLTLSRAELWRRVLAESVERFRNLTGNARDGARVLAARVAASNCLDTSALLPELEATPELVEALGREVAAFREDSSMVPRSPYSWSQKLRCIWVRQRVLGTPLPNDRAGVAAALTLLSILDADAKLARAYAELRQLRDVLHGKPGEDPLEQFRTVAGDAGPSGALGDLPGFYERLAVAFGGAEGAPKPAVFELPQTPVTQFLAQLQAAERVNAMDELAIAIQEGRVALTPELHSPWALYRASALAPLLLPEQEGGMAGHLIVDAPYRSRLTTAYFALQLAHRPEDEPSHEEEVPSDDGSVELKIRLEVPPHLEVEPLPAAYARAARSLERLRTYLESNRKAGALVGLTPDGRRRETLRAEVGRLAEVLEGLSLLSHQVAGPGPSAVDHRPDDDRALKAARKFLASWRSDPDLGLDVRALEAPLVVVPGEPVASGVFGVGRREVRSTFSTAPRVEVSSAAEGLVVPNVAAAQRYFIPVLATGSAVSANARHLSRAQFRALCDRSGRLREAIESALVDVLPVKPLH